MLPERPGRWRAALPRWCAVFAEDIARTPSMTTISLNRATSLSIFERMLLMRHFEEMVIQLSCVISISAAMPSRPGASGETRARPPARSPSQVPYCSLGRRTAAARFRAR